MSMLATEAKPLSRQQIRNFVKDVRVALGVNDNEYIDVQALIDLVLPKAIPNFHYDILELSAMRDKHGEANPQEMKINIREDVYEGMIMGEGRDRFTVLHEIGHLFLHQPERIVYSRKVITEKLPAFRDPEWQANCFAGEFLAYHDFAKHCSTPHQIVNKFGLSYQAANVQLQIHGGH